jgi:hypothetical protein
MRFIERGSKITPAFYSFLSIAHTRCSEGKKLQPLAIIAHGKFNLQQGMYQFAINIVTEGDK